MYISFAYLAEQIVGLFAVELELLDVVPVGRVLLVLEVVLDLVEPLQELVARVEPGRPLQLPEGREEALRGRGGRLRDPLRLRVGVRPRPRGLGPGPRGQRPGRLRGDHHVVLAQELKSRTWSVS